jgi:hypothetical protein
LPYVEYIEYQSAAIYHRQYRASLTSRAAHEQTPGFGLALLLPIGILAIVSIFIELVRSFVVVFAAIVIIIIIIVMIIIIVACVLGAS